MTDVFVDPPIVGEAFRLLGNAIPLRVAVYSVEMVDGALRIRLLINTEGGKVCVIGSQFIDLTAVQFVLARQTGKLVRS